MVIAVGLLEADTTALAQVNHKLYIFDLVLRHTVVSNLATTDSTNVADCPSCYSDYPSCPAVVGCGLSAATAEDTHWYCLSRN